LAKAFGAPIAAIAGCRRWIELIEAKSAARVHLSPPNAAALAAATHALEVNARAGDSLRRRLHERIRQLRAQLAGLGLRTRDDELPVQPVELEERDDPLELRDRLLAAGVRAVVVAPRCAGRRLVLLVTARHRRQEIDFAARALAQCLRRAPAPQRRAS
jgi:8-amino-7-oxononanoate synthase